MTDPRVAEIRRWPREAAVEIELLQKSNARLTTKCARLRKALEEIQHYAQYDITNERLRLMCEEALKA